MPDLAISVLFKGSNFWRLLDGLWITLEISLASAALSVALGLAFGMFMRINNPITKFISRIYLDFVRIMPQLVLLFAAYFWLSHLAGIDISGEACAIIVFTFWGAAEMGDLVRGALSSIPSHQYESAAALGFGTWQTYRYIVIPQTLRALAPLTINLVTRMIKTTSLVVLIGVVEIIKVAGQIIDANRFEYPTAALWVYGAVFFMYFFTCWPISLCAKWAERKWR